MDINAEYNKLCEICPTDCVFVCGDGIEVPFHRVMLAKYSETVRYMLKSDKTLTSIQAPMPSIGVLFAVKMMYTGLYGPKYPIAYRTLEFLEAQKEFLQTDFYMPEVSVGRMTNVIDTLKKWIELDVSPVLITALADSFDQKMRTELIRRPSIDDFALVISMMTPGRVCDTMVMARFYRTASKSGDVETERAVLGVHATMYRPMKSASEFVTGVSPELMTCIIAYVENQIEIDGTGADVFCPKLHDGASPYISYAVNPDSADHRWTHRAYITVAKAQVIKAAGRIPLAQ